jgi:fermentation-respiration switch protein FrsA (DUF1100 family)
LVVHGERDRVVPVAFGRQLFAAAKEPKESQWVSRGDHNDLHDHGIIPKVIDFLDRRVVKAGGK